MDKIILRNSDFPSGLSQPALRALAGAGLTSLQTLTRVSEAELKQLHGMGPKGIDTSAAPSSPKASPSATGKRMHSTFPPATKFNLVQHLPRISFVPFVVRHFLYTNFGTLR